MAAGAAALAGELWWLGEPVLLWGTRRWATRGKKEPPPFPAGACKEEGRQGAYFSFSALLPSTVIVSTPAS